ncbi:MAG TPA: sensor histidine kinase [Flavobacteriales bacterium]
MAFKLPNRRFWPITALAMALLFIIWDISLVSRARSAQQRIGEQVEVLDHLADLRKCVDQLTLVNRVDATMGLGQWAKEYPVVSARFEEVVAEYPGSHVMERLHADLRQDLIMCDSLRSEIARTTDPLEKHRHRAVLNIMLKRATSDLDASAQAIHEHGLAKDISNLGNNWREVQALLLIAFLMAVVFALLVGMNRRLLNASITNSAALQNAKQELEQANVQLERTNVELRETMLSKEEKEVMIKEIHHRVKNNLQIVRSLIRFQTDKVTDPRMLELFHECINRVGAMALVHEQTYLSKDLANIAVSGYMDSLVRDLVSAYNIRLKLHMDIDIQVKTLGVDTLIPLGLIINEIISNSFKHAFKDRTEGTIIVHLKGVEGALDLVIGDDGVGLPDRQGWEKPQSLGMELIHTLAGQLDASVELRPGKGTIYELRSIPVQVRKRA